MSQKKISKKKISYGNNKIFPLQTQLKKLDLALHSANRNWFQLKEIDYSIYDCPEDI